MIALDTASIEFPCPRCGFYNAIFFKQAISKRGPLKAVEIAEADLLRIIEAEKEAGA